MAGRSRFGSVRRLPSGRYQARYWTPDGERISAPDTFVRKRQAYDWLADAQVALARGGWIDERRARITLGEWADQWLESATSHLKPKTLVGYRSLARTVVKPTLGQVALGELRRSRIQAWVADLTRQGMSPSRIRQAYRLVSQLMKAAELDGVMLRNPCMGIRLPRIPEHEPTVLTPEQVTALAAELPPPYQLFVLALAYTGLRFGEAAGLRRRFVRPDDRLLVVAASLSDANGVLSMEEPKTHQHRMVTLPAFLADRLADHIAGLEFDDPEQLVFTSPGGFPIRHQNFMSRLWYPACERAGVSATPHALRASHATWLYDAGWSPVEIAARLGHDKATVTTKHYARRVVCRDVEIASGLDSTFRGMSSEDAGHAVGTQHGTSLIDRHAEE